MAQQVIDQETEQPNGKLGEPARTAFKKINDNFGEVYEAVFDEETGLANTRAVAIAARDKADAAYTKTNIIGNVSQAGGVPTGAIIQQGGALASGRYVRYADGTQICYAQIPFTMQNGTNNWQILFPAAFIAPTAANVQICAGNALARKMGVENIDTTNNAGFYENLAGAAAAVLHYTAIGRWY